MPKVSIRTLDSVTHNDTTATTLINENFAALQRAIENTVSRDGSVPNFMDANLDLNSYRIINAGAPENDSDVITKGWFDQFVEDASTAAADANAAAVRAESSAQSSQVSATNAINALVNAENIINLATELLTDTQTYVDSAKVEIDNTKETAIDAVEDAVSDLNQTVTQAKADIQGYVDDAEEEVRQIARAEAQEVIDAGKDEIEDYARVVVKPELDALVTSASESAVLASQKASESSNSATSASLSATQAQNSAVTAEDWARYAEGKGHPNWGYIGGDIEDQADLMLKFDTIDDKIKEIELFKFPNATIIGEPTIQNGQVSDFSTVSYLQFPFILDLHEKAFQIDMCFTTDTNVQTQQNILDSKFGIALAIKDGKGLMAVSSNGTSWDVGSVAGTQTIQSNTTYYARLIWNRLQYKTQLSTDGVNYVDDIIITDTRRPYPTNMFIGGCDVVETGHTGHPFLGSINMNKCTLSVMGSVIWQGMDDAGLSTRADISLSNLDEEGKAKFDAKQDVANLSQTLDDSTTKYPSNAAVKAAIDANGGGLEIGDIGIAPLGIDETQNKRRYLNGQVISQAQFVSFTDKLKSIVALYPNLATTEVNWQAEVTNSKLGQCGKFVIDDTLGTIRLPKVVNINGLQDLALLGGIKAESLPNFVALCGYDGQTGGWRQKVVQHSYRANSYQNNTAGVADIDVTYGSEVANKGDVPVQQEAVQYPYFIQVATGVETSIDVTREIELNNPFSLLDYKYSEYELSNASWLLSNGQFNSGAVYQSVYDLLLQIYNGTVTKAGVSVKLSTETYTDTDFVLNTGDTTFRLPTKVKLASGKAVAGNGMTLGLTNNGVNAGLVGDNAGVLRAYGGAYGSNIQTTAGPSTGVNAGYFGITTDPTKSGIETSANGLYLYFYVGETVQDANIIAATGVLTDMTNIKNASNFSSLGKETIVGWVLPDYSSEVSINHDLATDYTCPYKGYYFCNLDKSGGNYSAGLYVNNVLVTSLNYSSTYSSYYGAILCDVGDVISCPNPLTTRRIVYYLPFKE